MDMNLVAGKNILVMGVANDRSIAWAIRAIFGEPRCKTCFYI